LAGRDSHPLEIADFHGVLVSLESKKTVARTSKKSLPALVGDGQAWEIVMA